jgi:hypothetical protein
VPRWARAGWALDHELHGEVFGILAVAGTLVAVVLGSGLGAAIVYFGLS